MKKLTPKQAAFVKWYTSGECYGNGTEAARRAGYKGKPPTLGQVANENLKKPNVAAAVEEARSKSNVSAVVTVEKVLKDLEDTRLRAIADGKYSAALRASELQGKTMAMFTDRIEQVRSVDDVEVDELLGLVSELTQRLDAADLQDITRRFTGDGAQDSPVPGAPGAPTTH